VAAGKVRLGRVPGAALIIAGGAGSRFWPLSRERQPKALFKLDGKTTLLAATILRHCPLIPLDHIFVIAPAALEDVLRHATRGLLPAKNLIVEPEARGTTVAIAYGCAQITRRLGECVLVVAPADHYLTPPPAYRATLRTALSLATTRQAIVLIGIPPTAPETAYGYFKIGQPTDGGFEVARFVEKPDLKTAEIMLSEGGFLWNSGIFIMHSHVLTDMLKAHCPALLSALEKCSRTTREKARALFSKLNFDSFDYAVLEKSSGLLAVRARFKWHDVGSWDGLWKATRGRDGNALCGRVLSFDTRGVLAHSPERLMVLLGVEDLVAVDAGDAVLIARRSRSEQVREMVAELKRRKLHNYL
jgi:mannose-1-phosphate guanylyltransferase/mannose-6-phosphate isomerase